MSEQLFASALNSRSVFLIQYVLGPPFGRLKYEPILTTTLNSLQLKGRNNARNKHLSFICTKSSLQLYEWIVAANKRKKIYTLHNLIQKPCSSTSTTLIQLDSDGAAPAMLDGADLSLVVPCLDQSHPIACPPATRPAWMEQPLPWPCPAWTRAAHSCALAACLASTKHSPLPCVPRSRAVTPVVPHPMRHSSLAQRATIDRVRVD
jgi:hypothetical protein